MQALNLLTTRGLAPLLAVAVLAACDLAARPPLDASPTEPTPSTLPTAALASPRTDLSWAEHGEIDGVLDGVISNELGYLAYGYRSDDAGRYWTWFSTDGAAWMATPLPLEGPACPGGRLMRHPASATDGRSVALVARAAGCTVAWITPDGHSWQKSAPFGATDTSDDVAVWWAPEGFEAVLGSLDGGSTIVWRAPDGLDWQPIADLGIDYPLALFGAADAGGRRLLAGPRTLTSLDGRTWVLLESLAGLPDRNLAINGVVPPSEHATEWVLWLHHSDGATRTFTSDDLAAWREAPLPVRWVEDLASTRHGYIVLARGEIAGGAQVMPFIQLLGSDALAWSRLAGSVRWVSLVTDGPAGVLALGTVPNENRGTPDVTAVWRLAP